MTKRKKALVAKVTSSWEKVAGAALDEFTAADKAPDESDDSRYQGQYYERNKSRLSEEAKQRWKNNEGGYRDRGLERAKAKRANERSKKAVVMHEVRKAKFVQGQMCVECGNVEEGIKNYAQCPGPKCGEVGTMVEVYLQDSGDEWTIIKTRKPRRVSVRGVPMWVYSSGAMGLKCAKSPSTMRTWIEERVIPGYTYKDSGRYWFSLEFMEAVAAAVLKVLYLDGRGKLDILRRYVGAELADRKIKYTRFPKR